METTAQRIERILRDELKPSHFELFDDSAKHAGHAGAASGGGHYRVVVVAESFRGNSLIERHRKINTTLAGLIGGEIHALSMQTLTPEEWEERRGPS